MSPNNDIASCNTTGYVVFGVLGCDKSATKLIKQIDKLFMDWFHKILWMKNKQKKDFTEVKPLLMDLFDCMFCDPHGSQVKLL